MNLKISIEEKKYGGKWILQQGELYLETGNIYGVVGKNGQGKTTLFKCVLGLEDYVGEVLLDQKSLNKHQVAWCPTEPLIYDELTALEFKSFYCELLKIKKQDVSQDLFEVPQHKLIKEMSTGMKKKVYLNAMFQKDFPVYILDEPFNGLDVESNYRLMEYLKEKSKVSIVILSSHVLDSLYRNCSSIFLLESAKLQKFKKDKFEEIEALLFH